MIEFLPVFAVGSFFLLTFGFARLLKIHVALAALMAVPFVVLAAWQAVSLADDCAMSDYLNEYLSKHLSAREYASLKGETSVCPTGYTFTQDSDGKREFVYVIHDILHGPKIYFGVG